MCSNDQNNNIRMRYDYIQKGEIYYFNHHNCINTIVTITAQSPYTTLVKYEQIKFDSLEGSTSYAEHFNNMEEAEGVLNLLCCWDCTKHADLLLKEMLVCKMMEITQHYKGKLITLKYNTEQFVLRYPSCRFM